MTLSVLKKLDIKRLIGRAVNPVHHNILQELGIEEIIHPEEDTATEVASMLMLPHTVNAMIVNDKHIIAEVRIPAAYIRPFSGRRQSGRKIRYQARGRQNRAGRKRAWALFSTRTTP